MSAPAAVLTSVALVPTAATIGPVNAYRSGKPAHDPNTAWWRKDRERDKVVVDYNQSARDHTIASAYSVRGVREATVSTPVTWDEIDSVMPHGVTIATVPHRFATRSDPHDGIDDAAFRLERLLEWDDRDAQHHR